MPEAVAGTGRCVRLAPSWVATNACESHSLPQIHDYLSPLFLSLMFRSSLQQHLIFSPKTQRALVMSLPARCSLQPRCDVSDSLCLSPPPFMMMRYLPYCTGSGQIGYMRTLRRKLEACGSTACVRFRLEASGRSTRDQHSWKQVACLLVISTAILVHGFL